MAQLYSYVSDRCDDEQVAQYDEVLCQLAELVEVEARTHVARLLAPLERAPGNVVNKLANDEIDVAQPLLEFSNVLSDDDLIDIVSTRSEAHRVAIAIQAAGIGRIPFIALGLALSFGFYGFFRKTAKVNSASGLFTETLLLFPLALLWIGWTLIHQGGPGLLAEPYYFWLLALTGPATAVPLLLFAFAVQRLRLTTIGMLQYVGPTIQFLLAISVLGESINLTQLLSFGLIWLSLLIYSADSVFRRRAAERP
jgi:uncharacterized membrane protein